MDGQERKFSVEEEAAREQFVVDQFERVGLDIHTFPELFERFKKLHSHESRHFEDATQMVEIIEAIWDELGTKLPFKLDKEKLVLATLLHDVGKTGPKESKKEEQEFVITLFDPRHYQAIRKRGEGVEQMSVLHALRASNIDQTMQRKIAKYLNRLGVDIVAEKMIDFWRRHADWTFNILSQNQGGKITAEMAAMAASHHILDGKNPAQLDLENVPGEAKTIEMIESYEVITLVDKFQAFVQRSGLSHEEAVAVLRKIIDHQNLPEKVRGDYRTILDIIDSSRDKLQNILKSRS